MPTKLHSSPSHKTISFSLKTLTAAVFSAMLCSSSYAAGLGKLTVLSSLGQPLRAEIELTSVTKDEVGLLVAKLAPTDAYRKANIEFNPVLFSLRFTVEQKGQRQFINVTSTQAVNEPFVDMLLELGGGNSRLVREYTFLLDPADLRMKQPVQVAAPVVPVITVQRPAAEKAAESKETAQAVTVKPVEQVKPLEQTKPPEQTKAIEQAKPVKPTEQAKTEQAKPVMPAPVNKMPKDEKGGLVSGDYKIKNGDSLSKIANQFKGDGVSLDQMLVALYRDNPKAFDGKNMNRLRAGVIISIPDASVALDVPQPAAHGVVLAQAEDFSKYRNKLAAHVDKADAQKTSESKQSSTGKITAKVEEKKTTTTDAKDKLKLSKADAATSVNANANVIKPPVNTAAAEEAIAKTKALADANARVKELEKNFADLQKVLELKNKDLAEQQKQAELLKAANAAKTTPVASVPVPPVAPVVVAAPVVAPEVAPKPAEPVAEKPASAVAAASIAPVVQPPKVAAVAKPPLVVAPVEKSFVEELLDNTILLAGLGGALLLGAGAFVFNSVRRKKQSQQFEDSTLNDSNLKANSLFGSTGGQSVDTNNSVFNSNFSPSASQLDTNEVDPVAEADVYIAYGRDAQAEEILKEALRTQPERNAVRVKLLEIYANRKDIRTFEVLASELYSMTKGEGSDWEQVASLGAGIDPANPLYAGGKTVDPSTVQNSALAAATQPLEELDLDDLLNTTQSEVPKEDGHDLSFASTMLIENPPTIDLPVDDEVPEEESVPVVAKPDANGLDFDLDGMGIVPEAKAPEIPPEPLDLNIGALDFGFTESQDVALDIPASAVTPAHAEQSLDLDASDFSLDIDSPDMESGSQPSALHQGPAGLDLDLSGISLDLNPAPSTSADFNLDLNPVESAPADMGLDLHIPESDMDGDFHADSEMATKLDLAIAYQEIGDKDGARELLDEVMKGGTTEQSEKAKLMLAKLA